MNWLAQPASADAFAGVQGSTVASLPATFFASASAADCRLAASSVPITLGCRKGKALLLRSSASPGTSSVPRVVSPSRSRTVLRYSREVSRRSGMSPAALGSPGAPPDPGDAPAGRPAGPPPRRSSPRFRRRSSRGRRLCRCSRDPVRPHTPRSRATARGALAPPGAQPSAHTSAGLSGLSSRRALRERDRHEHYRAGSSGNLRPKSPNQPRRLHLAITDDCTLHVETGRRRTAPSAARAPSSCACAVELERASSRRRFYAESTPRKSSRNNPSGIMMRSPAALPRRFTKWRSVSRP